MATVKKNNKKKIVIPIVIVLIIAILAGSIVVVKAKTGAPEVTLTTISTDTIIENISATGDVTAGATSEYKPAVVANCKEVFVKVGDTVKKGDTLATFDTENLDSQIASLEATYKNAKASYNSAVKSQKEAKAKLASVNAQIAKLEKQVNNAKKNQTTTKKNTKNTTKKSTTKKTTTKKSETTRNIKTNTRLNDDVTAPSESSTRVPVTYPNDLSGMVEAINDLVETINDLAEDIETTNALTRVVMTAIAEAMQSGEYSPEKIADLVGDAVAKAIKEGLVDETKLIIESGIAIDMIETAVKNVNWKAISDGVMNSDNVTLTAAQLQLAALYAEKTVFSASADSSVVNAQKQVVDTAKSALDTVKASQAELASGWKASMDGTITECNIVAGGQTTALETGIKLENMDEMVATISLGEYDVHKVRVGMEAKIKTAYGQYDGEVASIAPTATGGSSGSILDSVGSMAGISGLSSLTASGAGVECTITINNPDENIIIGFDADVTIQTGDYSGVATVPSEAMVFEKEGKFVYKYNEEDGTVTKTKIETGATSNTSYEIKDGLKVGDKIVKAPASDYEEDTFKVRVKQ